MKKFVLSLLLATSSFALMAENYLFFSPQSRASHLKQYDEQEKIAIEKDLAIVRGICLPDIITYQGKPTYLATAGAPGARKSTILERCLKEYPAFSHMAYIDPDQRTLKFMVNTYYCQSLAALAIAGYQDYGLATKAAYEKWRGGSNYIALTLLEEAFAQHRDIAHGTTCTGEHVPMFFSKLKEAGYDIVLLLCSCEDSFRQQSIEYRNTEQRFYQCSAEDAVKKGQFFPQRMPAYFMYADQMYLFWSDDLTTQECLAATLVDGHLNVIDQEALNKFIRKFEADRMNLQKEGKQLPSWQELVNLACSRQKGS